MSREIDIDSRNSLQVVTEKLKGFPDGLKHLAIGLFNLAKAADGGLILLGILSAPIINIPLSLIVGGGIAVKEMFEENKFDLKKFGKIYAFYIQCTNTAIENPWVARGYGLGGLAVGYLGLKYLNVS